MKNKAEMKIEHGFSKYQKTETDENPNRNFVENKFILSLTEDDKFNLFLARHKNSEWADESEQVLKKMIASIQEKEYYQKYMSLEKTTLKDDCLLARRIFENEFEDNIDLEELLEEKSLLWIDDMNFVLNVILRNIKHFYTCQTKESEEKNADLFSMADVQAFMKEEDKDFAVELLKSTLVNYDEYYAKVNDMVTNWERDRVVATDMVLIVQGIMEAIKFPEIPTKVTINEYVEISKYYSTDKSKIFVNGLLDKIIYAMVSSGEVVKKGRGLIES
ncbi:MAG: transcription antitermination factor NusB [Bacteroidales bacterium]